MVDREVAGWQSGQPIIRRSTRCRERHIKEPQHHKDMVHGEDIIYSKEHVSKYTTVVSSKNTSTMPMLGSQVLCPMMLQTFTASRQLSAGPASHTLIAQLFQNDHDLGAQQG
jgi:hypothetical protein